MPTQRCTSALAVATLLVAVSGFSSRRLWGQTSSPSAVQAPLATTSKPVEAPAAEALRKTVAYLTTFYQDKDGGKSIQGTAFFVLVQDPAGPANYGQMYAVTNRHMVQPKDDLDKPFAVTEYRLRINMRDPNGPDRAVEARLASPEWSFPTDDAIDLAVCPLSLDQSKFDFEVIQTDFFETSEKIDRDRVSEGANIIFDGFFYQVPGQSKIHPIARQGTLALLSDEKMDTTLHGLGLLYLADMHVFGGNSGSPAFVNLAGFQGQLITFSSFPYRLLGVVSGYIQEANDGSLTSVVSTPDSGKTNSGIATIVPAQQLLDLLNSPQLLQKREAQFKSHPPPAMPPKS